MNHVQLAAFRGHRLPPLASPVREGISSRIKAQRFALNVLQGSSRIGQGGAGVLNAPLVGPSRLLVRPSVSSAVQVSFSQCMALPLVKVALLEHFSRLLGSLIISLAFHVPLVRFQLSQGFPAVNHALLELIRRVMGGTTVRPVFLERIKLRLGG